MRKASGDAALSWHGVFAMCALFASSASASSLAIKMHSTACRFSTTLLGSRALVGTLVQPHDLLLQQGLDGLNVRQVLQQHGYDTTKEAVAAVAMQPSQVCSQNITL